MYSFLPGSSAQLRRRRMQSAGSLHKLASSCLLRHTCRLGSACWLQRLHPQSSPPPAESSSSSISTLRSGGCCAASPAAVSPAALSSVLAAVLLPLPLLSEPMLFMSVSLISSCRAGQGGAGQRRGKGRLAHGNFTYKRCTCNQALVTAGCRWPAEQACTGWAAMAWLAPDCQGTTHDPFPSLPSPSGAASRTPGQRQQISGGR